MRMSAEDESPENKQVSFQDKTAIQLINDGADGVAAIRIFDSEASPMASNSAAADVVAGNLTQYLPTAPSIAAGHRRSLVNQPHRRAALFG